MGCVRQGAWRTGWERHVPESRKYQMDKLAVAHRTEAHDSQRVKRPIHTLQCQVQLLATVVVHARRAVRDQALKVKMTGWILSFKYEARQKTSTGHKSV